MKDNEIHFYGDDHKFNLKWLLLIPAIALVAALAYFGYDYFKDNNSIEPVNGQPAAPIVKQTEKDSIFQPDTTLLHSLLTTNTDSELLVHDTTINDIPISIFIPSGGKMQIRRDYSVIQDTADIILCFAAANAGSSDKIVGSFVYNGEEISRGQSQKGFCAIINDTVTIGMSEYSPLFEEAIDKKGCFFRQRALIDSGEIIYNELRGQFLCRALCQKDDRHFAVICRERCSLFDFSQTLHDIGVTQAILLQSAEGAKGWYHDKNGNSVFLGNSYNNGNWTSRKYPKSANFIVWSVK